MSAIAQAIIKAILLKLAVRNADRVKENAYRKHLGLSPIHPCYQRPFRALGRGIKWICMKTCCICCPGSRETTKEELGCWGRLWTSGTVSNTILKSIVGFISGLLCTLALYYFLRDQLNLGQSALIGITIAIGIFLSFGLAFSELIQCLCLLALPQFFTRKGRTAILVYALILATSGPAKNTANNMEVLSESLLCAQELARNATSELANFIKEPMQAIKKTFKDVGEELKGVAKDMLKEFNFVLESVTSVVNAIKKAYKWLKSAVNVCNKKAGTPFDRCWSHFQDAWDNCIKEMGLAFFFLCTPVQAVQGLCYTAKTADVICWLPTLIKEQVFAPIKEKLKEFLDKLKKQFDIRIDIDYNFDHKLTPSKGFKEVLEGMRKEIHDKISPLTRYLNWFDLVATGFLLLALYKAYKYRARFLSIDRHDNRYITTGLIRLDEERKRVGREVAGIFPLKYRESTKYIPPLTLFMVKSERKRLSTSLTLITMQGINILIILALDSGLYAFLELIRTYCGIKMDFRDSFGYEVKVEGEGFLASMYRALLITFSPLGDLIPNIDTTPCLPIGSEPDYSRYIFIGFLILSCYFLAYTEAYGLRLRHWICGRFYPERKIPRDRWLYIHILSSRGSFYRYAAEQIRARIAGDNAEPTFRVGLCSRLRHTFPFCRILWRVCGWSEGKKCFLCGRPGDMDDLERFTHCPICDTVYCQECFEDMRKKCPACLSPLDSDWSGFSEEKGSSSSSDEEIKRKRKRRKYRKNQKSRVKLLENEDGEVELDEDEEGDMTYEKEEEEESDHDQMRELNEDLSAYYGDNEEEPILRH